MDSLSIQWLTTGLPGEQLALGIHDSFSVTGHKSKEGYCTGHYSPSVPLFIGSITMMPCVQGLELVGPWTSRQRARMCSVGPMTLAQTSLDAYPKPRNHNGAIMAWMAKVRPYQLTLTWLGNVISRESETPDAWYCLREYHRQANLLMWESVPMPLLPHPTPT